MTGHDDHGHGAVHPINGRGDPAWEFAPGVFAWKLDGDVVIQGDDGDVTIPATHLPLLARALLAAHVANGRTKFEEPAP